MGNFRKSISIITAVCFYFTSTASHANIPPLNLSQMYGYASSGNVRALRAAVQRGMNIDTVDRNGDTGLCYAIKRNNKTAYNAFRAAGSNPKHGCTQNIPRQQYNSFMNSSGVVGLEETPRAAYTRFDKGEFVISTKTWVIGGLLLAGAGVALAAGGGGGGGGGGGHGYKATNDNLGDFAGTLKPYDAPAGYQAIYKKAQNGSSYTNTESLTFDNDRMFEDGKYLLSWMDFNSNILEYAKYIQVAFKAYQNTSLTNNGTINLKNVTAGLVALGNGATAFNNNIIQINAASGTVGMIASDNGQATNGGDILMSFEGSFDTHQIIGIYSDTNGLILNNKNIKTISSNATAGTLVGMQGRIINQEDNPTPAYATKLTNGVTGVIDLSNTSTSSSNATALVGMGSYIEEDFTNGKKLLSRAGYVEITNSGQISVKSSLVGSSSYVTNIREANNGIIGIRADANTTATNTSTGTVNVEVESNDDADFTGSHAGMLSVHGGTLLNQGAISVKGGTEGYGMIAIRGNGTNSEFDVRKPTLTNTGSINMDSIGGYGMISLHGGSISNTNQINFASTGTGIHSNAGTINNTGVITMNSGGKGITVIRNPVGEGSTNYDTAGTAVNNSGTVNINKADDSYGIYIEYGTLNNNGIVNVENIISSVSKNNYGLYAVAGTVNNTGQININVNNVDPTATPSYGIYSENANVNNLSSGKITFELKGVGILSENGKVTNDGTITMKSGGDGISSMTGNIVNNGTVKIEGTGVGILSDSGTIENLKLIDVDADNSSGIQSSGIVYNGTASNNANAEININGKDGTGIYVENGKVYNYGKIIINSNLDGTQNAGIVGEGSTTIDNYGQINLVGNSAYINNNYGTGISAENGSITNNAAITISGFFGYGITATGSGTILNKAGIMLSNGGIGIDGNAGSSSVNSAGVTISITGSDMDPASYGMYTTEGTARNDGTIELNDQESFGVFANGGQGVNNGTININKINSVGLGVSGATGVVMNTSSGKLNVVGADSYGMMANEGKAYNMGNINLTGNGTIGVYTENGEGFNSGTIEYVGGVDAFGMMTSGGTVTNSSGGTIKISQGIGMQTSNSGTAVNNSQITISGGSVDDYITTSGMQATLGGKVTNGTNGTIDAVATGMTAFSGESSAENAGKINISAGLGYGMVAIDGAKITNLSSGVIKLAQSGSGMYVEGEGTQAVNSGSIGMLGGYGMYGVDGAELINMANGKITVTTAAADTYGMAVTGTDSKAYNRGTISLSGTTANTSLIGMFTTGGAAIVNDVGATINISSTTNTVKAYGMYATGADSKAVNRGTINITSNNTASAGIIALNGALVYNAATGIINITGSGNGIYAVGTTTDTSYVYNDGTIKIGTNSCSDDDCNASSYISIGDNAEFVTGSGGITISSTAINFNDWTLKGGKIVVEKDGKYEAPEISGIVYAGSNITTDSFNKSFVSENAFIGDSSELELLSNSYMFNAELVENRDGNKDVVMTMKEFDEVVSDKYLAKYLNNAYDLYNASGETESKKAQNALTLFNAVKNANNQNGLTKAVNNFLGLDFFPSFARQNLEAVKSLNRQVNNSVFANNDPREVVAMMGYDFIQKDQEASGAVEGYEEDAHSVYGLVQKRYNNNFSYGAGFTITQLNSEYDNSSKRDDTLVHILAPLKYQTDTIAFVSMPRVGLGWGDYRRVVSGNIYKADTKNYYYGVTNEVRKDIDLGFFTLEPTAEFNVLGVYQTKTKEKQQLTVKSSNSLSVEGGLGLYAKKTFEIDDFNSVKVRIGGTFYQEFGDTYGNSNATMFGMPGYYNMKGYESDKSRGLISGRLDYYFKSLNLFTEAGKIIERDGSYEIKAGVEYKF
ncbi:MAG: ankyrin repeat domain-containing protein [Lactobacillaceae bacterium]|jgi:hypothetical protein|nr:ankyrin repeat domain-containing protein [Lactobacillaceae bacterium]